MISNKQDWKRILPLPKTVELQDECISLGADWRLAGYSGDAGVDARWRETFRLCAGAAGKAVVLETAGDWSDERYEVVTAEETVTVRAKGAVGFEHALRTLWQLSPDGRLRRGRIADFPLLKMRGFHVDFWSVRQLGREDAEYLMRQAADLKLNTVLIEYAERFPYQKHARTAVPTTLAPEDVAHLVEAARRHGLEVIPLQQSLGHLDYVLAHDAYAEVREEHGHRDQLCPSHPGAFTLFTELAEEIIAAHPGIRYLHIGGDEAMRLGHCPRCKAAADARGVGRLFTEYINKVSRWVKDRGLTPIMWDDMVCSHWDEVDDLDRDIVLMYWDYWTTGQSSPFVVARPVRPELFADARWGGEWAGELTDLERTILQDFVTLQDSLEESLTLRVVEHFAPYLGAEFPKRMKGMPYYEYYRDKGFKVIGAPTALGNGDNYHTLPNGWRFVPNIRTHCERCLEAGGEGVITTAWYNYAPLVFHQGLAATAQFAWGVPDLK